VTLLDIGIFVVGALLYAALVPGRWRGWALMVASVLAIYWLQLALSIRYLDFWLPTLTLIVTVFCWFIVRQPDPPQPYLGRDDRLTLGVVIALVLLLAANRYLAAEVRLTASRPPEIITVILVLILLAALTLLIVRRWRDWHRWPSAGMIALVGLFILIKWEPLAQAVSGVLRAGVGQDTRLASMVDLGWLGFSYVAFRLIHTLRDDQTGLLPPLSLREYLTYVIFFPAYTAGPIDRAGRFIVDWEALPGLRGLDASRITEGLARISVGLFKKFVIADTLALIALDATKAQQAESALGLWLLVYAYAFRLFFDFSGYSDIAIGIGILLGIRLPENFDRPYLKHNITLFWQSWHMTLTNWVRFYIFTPLSRALLRRKQRPSTEVIMLICHLTTMAVIGLWHGITWTFLVWGLWHGLALFLHKVWSDRTRKWYRQLGERPRWKQAYTLGGVVLTFHYVALGWVWFALSDVTLAGTVLLRLLGLPV
jgi:D-alanyl-lipoteichoic acid acyltransferase DltB (MBOAT superfamily)